MRKHLPANPDGNERVECNSWCQCLHEADQRAHELGQPPRVVDQCDVRERYVENGKDYVTKAQIGQETVQMTILGAPVVHDQYGEEVAHERYDGGEQVDDGHYHRVRVRHLDQSVDHFVGHVTAIGEEQHGLSIGVHGRVQLVVVAVD